MRRATGQNAARPTRWALRRAFLRLGAWLAAALLAAGCASAPTLALYRPALASGFANGGASAQEPVAQFWRGFHDAELDLLVAQALAANADLRIARANVREARALARYAQAQGAPQLSLDASAGRQRARDAQGQALAANAVGVGLDVLWEADLFGAVGNERRAAAAEALASEAQLRAAGVSVAAEVARTYFELRGLQERLRVAAAALATQRAALELVSARLDAGRGDAFDTERASALVQSTAATVPALEAALARARYRLAVLSGQPPTALDARLAPLRPLPGLAPTALARIASPQALLRRRPDVAAAEQRVAAAAARIGVARAALFPRLTLSGMLGLNAGSVGRLDEGNAYTYSLGAALAWRVFDGGRLRAQLGAAGARGDAAMAAYERTVLLALEETEGALATFTHSQRETDALFGAARAADLAADLARERFGAGRSDFLAVLDAEREQLAARERLAQASTGSAVALVAVYRALAGGW